MISSLFVNVVFSYLQRMPLDCKWSFIFPQKCLVWNVILDVFLMLALQEWIGCQHCSDSESGMMLGELVKNSHFISFTDTQHKLVNTSN